MKSILFITYTHSNGGGAESLLTTYVNELCKKDYKITIFEIERFYQKKEPIDKKVILKKLPLHYSKVNLYSLLFNRSNFYLLYNKPELLKTVFNLDNFDIVITWNYQLPSFMLPAFKNSYKIGYFHTDINDLDISNVEKTNIDIIYANKMQYDVWLTTDKIITISNNSYRSMQNVFPSFVDKTSIINNGVNANEVLTKANEKLSHIKLNDNNIHIACFGRVDKNKNFKLLILALKKVLEVLPNVDLLIIGKGDEEENLKALTKKLNIENNVLFLGYQQNPFPIMKKASVICISSFTEGWPMVAMEAITLNIPFVTTAVSGASEELSNNNKCGLVAKWDEEDYAKKILQILQNKQLYENMQNEQKLIANKYTLENSIKQFCEIFDAVQNQNKEKTSKLNYVKYIFATLLLVDITSFKNAIKRFFDEQTFINFLKIIYRFTRCFIKMILSYIFIPIKIIVLPFYLLQTRR